MRSLLPVALFGLAGLLVGGAWTLYRQGAARPAVAVVAVLAVLAVAGGAFWLIPADS